MSLKESPSHDGAEITELPPVPVIDWIIGLIAKSWKAACIDSSGKDNVEVVHAADVA